LITPRAIEAIESSDTDDLIRVIDGLCAAALWDDLVELKERCSEAVGRGKQLWGVEEHIRYRLTLEAPGPWSGAAVSEGVARFAPGPLPEVAASTKTWTELSPHLDSGPWRGVVAAERVVRGEVVEEVLDLPGRLLAWEPRYPVATYKADKVEAPSPTQPSVEPRGLSKTVSTIDDDQSEAALADLVQPWVTESNGRAATVTVEGDALVAIRALGLRAARTAVLDTSEAMAWMAWAGASGGAYGRRRGAAAGRYGAWWAVATICDLDWPVEPERMTQAVTRLEFVWFDDGSPGTGWELRLALADPEEGLAWAISAVDQSD
jgi:hypothetical protein